MEANFGGLTWSDPTSALWFERFTMSSGQPRFYTITGNPLFPGRLVVMLTPYPTIVRTIDFYYHRRPRPLVGLPSFAEGTVSTVAGSAIVTGNGTRWFPGMAGAVFRLGTATVAPTSVVSTAPAQVEATILEVLSATSLRADVPMPATSPSLLYVISDPIEFELGVMLTAYLRGVEKQLSIGRTMTDKPDAFASYDRALKEACAADSRSLQGRAMGPARDHRNPYKYMPANFFPT